MRPRSRSAPVTRRVSPTPIPLAATLLSATLLATTPLSAQQVIDLPPRDHHLDPTFEEVFRVGVLDGEPWEMFATIPRVAFDATGTWDGRIWVMRRGDELLEDGPIDVLTAWRGVRWDLSYRCNEDAGRVRARRDGRVHRVGRV